MAGKKKGSKNPSKTESSNEQDFVDIEVEEVSEEVSASNKSDKSKGSFLLYLLLFIAVSAGLGFAAYKYVDKKHLNFLYANQQADDELEVLVLQEVETPFEEQPSESARSPIEQEDLKYEVSSAEVVSEDENAEQSLLEEVAGVIENAGENVARETSELVESTEKLVDEMAESLTKQDIQIAQAQSAQLRLLRQQNKNILLYISAQNLQDFLLEGNERKLGLELDFFNSISSGNGGYLGKVQILEYSLDGGLLTSESLAKELGSLSAELESAKEKTFWQNLKGEVFGLIKVTKLDENAEGEDASDAKILLANKALKSGDLNKAIELVQKLGNDSATEWVKNAHKLKRAHEASEYLVGMTRKKLVADATGSFEAVR